MRHPVAVLIVGSIGLLCGCSSPRRPESKTASGELSERPVQPVGKSISLVQLSGRWNVRVIPELGDTTSISFLLTATSSTNGWTITFPDQKPIPARVLLVAGDSVLIETGPFPSTRRPGVQTIARDVYHLRVDELVGTAVWRDLISAPDSIVRMRLAGSHAP